MIVGGNEGLIGTVLLGIVGGGRGRMAGQHLLHKGDVTGLNVESIVVAVIGSIIVLFVYRALIVRRSGA